MGHTFDGIEEINNPLPKWWSICSSSSSSPGSSTCSPSGPWQLQGSAGLAKLQPGCAFLGRSPRRRPVCQGRRTRGGIRPGTRQGRRIYGAKFRELTYQADGKSYKEITEIAKDPEAFKVGQRLFLQNCSQCHGSDARGGRGFPNLTDSEWQWGGAPTRSRPPSWAVVGDHGRLGRYPGSGRGEEVASYVLSLSGRKVDLVEAKEREHALPCAPPATVRMPRAASPSAHRISPTTSGSMAAPVRWSNRPSPTGATA